MAMLVITHHHAAKIILAHKQVNVKLEDTMEWDKPFGCCDFDQYGYSYNLDIAQMYNLPEAGISWFDMHIYGDGLQGDLLQHSMNFQAMRCEEFEMRSHAKKIRIEQFIDRVIRPILSSEQIGLEKDMREYLDIAITKITSSCEEKWKKATSITCFRGEWAFVKDFFRKTSCYKGSDLRAGDTEDFLSHADYYEGKAQRYQSIIPAKMHTMELSPCSNPSIKFKIELLSYEAYLGARLQEAERKLQQMKNSLNKLAFKFLMMLSSSFLNLNYCDKKPANVDLKVRVAKVEGIDTKSSYDTIYHKVGTRYIEACALKFCRKYAHEFYRDRALGFSQTHTFEVSLGTLSSNYILQKLEV
jgi:hypothetical protein